MQLTPLLLPPPWSQFVHFGPSLSTRYAFHDTDYVLFYIAVRLEAIAIRLEGISSNIGWRPSLVGGGRRS